MSIETGNYSKSLGIEYFQNSLINAAKKSVKRKKYFQEDFHKYFGVEFLQHTIVDPEVLPYLEKHDITQDPLYSDMNVQRRINLHSYFLDRGNFPDDRRVYVAYASPETGMGVFANVYIPEWTIIDEYVGIITNKFPNTDYAWDYHSKLKISDDEEMILKLDARTKGNITRFLNHSDDPNCDVIHVPYKNRWRTLYVTNRAIQPDEEVTVYYGKKYWDSRKKVDM